MHRYCYNNEVDLVLMLPQIVKDQIAKINQ